MEKRNCAYHAERPAETSCAGCGRPLCNEHPDAPNGRGKICPACVSRTAADDALNNELERRENNLAAESSTDVKRRNRNRLMIAVIIMCAFIIVYQVIVTGGFSGPNPSPYRVGSADTDATADQCIHNLWEISRAMQSGDFSPEKWTCPSCGRPYIIEGDPAAPTGVRCPCPSAHNLTRLGVTRNEPIPEAVP